MKQPSIVTAPKRQAPAIDDLSLQIDMINRQLDEAAERGLSPKAVQQLNERKRWLEREAMGR